MDSLKALDLELPIREADMGARNAFCVQSAKSGFSAELRL
jgi:hypothetical protein